MKCQLHCISYKLREAALKKVIFKAFDMWTWKLVGMCVCDQSNPNQKNDTAVKTVAMVTLIILSYFYFGRLWYFVSVNCLICQKGWFL